MSNFNKITIKVFALIFCIYAISPIIVSMPNFSPIQSTLGDDTCSARLMIFEILAGVNASQDTALKSSDDVDIDILLMKKRAILSAKSLLETITSDSVVLDRPLVDHILAYDAPKPSYYSSQHFFVSGVSPPAIS